MSMMTRTPGKRLTRFAVLAGVALAASASTAAMAQVPGMPVKIENRFRSDQQINVEKGRLESSPAFNSWHSADWLFEPLTMNGQPVYRLKNRFTGVYLNTEREPVQATNIDAGAHSSYWVLEKADPGYYRLKNYYRNTYLHTESGVLTAGAIDRGAWSSQWRLIGLNGPEPFTQCVNNVFGTGIIARVKWYDPDKVQYIEPDPRGDNADTKDVDESKAQLKVGFVKPVREDSINVGQQSCFAGIRPAQKPHMAIVSVVGGEFANQAVSVALSTAIAIGGAVACVATAAVACPAVVGSVAAVGSGAVSLATLGLPEAKEVFYIGVPGKLDVTGTAFNPSASEKAPIS